MPIGAVPSCAQSKANLRIPSEGVGHDQASVREHLVQGSKLLKAANNRRVCCFEELATLSPHKKVFSDRCLIMINTFGKLAALGSAKLTYKV